MNQPAPSAASPTPPKPGQTPNVVLVYQNPAAQQHAMELWDRVVQLVGNDVARCASWSVGELSNPGVLGEAVAATIQAQVIIVAIQAAGKLPPGLGVWIEGWLPHRHQLEGALMAVLGLAAQPDASLDQVQEYLRAIARQAGLDFLLQEHLIALSPSISISKNTPAGTASNLAVSARAVS